ncbi:SAM-dependent methyltransferase [Actinomycetospora termitidis]|uniref:SAM-dependent methyltransferase n=1 Tax=Actinomycetospora termitidis TaxID=3053470 RepID=A0ABT7MB43_9PSEU|nr:SAM-dependent methyltransferase [Actinomycetospora sp. Odt1-22]MDL5157883.1 SAM-dependent methyltransferase [Actinomycetospora sp. Odt1-22]
MLEPTRRLRPAPVAPAPAVPGGLAERGAAPRSTLGLPPGSIPGQPGPPSDERGRVAAVGSSPDEFEQPSSARVYDYLLGGAAHGAIDRQLGDELTAARHDVVALVRENRAFLRRAVRFLLAAGIDQFLDLGSGVPTMGNVHEVIARSRAGARVAYTDIDSIAAMHGQQLLAALPTATYTAVDVTDVEAVLSAPGVAGLLDLRRPVGVLAFSVLQHVPGDAAGLVASYLSHVVPGSALALSHYTTDDPGATDRIERLTARYAHSDPRARTRAEVADVLAGVDLVEPGITWAGEWRPEAGRPPGPDDARGHWAAVGFLR